MTSASDSNKVEQFILDIELQSVEFAEIVKELRDLFVQHDKQLHQTIKYKGLAFLRDNNLVGGIFTHKGHVSVEFSYGIQFDDPDGYLAGTGQTRRHLKLKTPKDITNRKAEFYIAQV